MSVVDPAAAKNLLVELFVEELPPKALKKLGEAFAQGLLDGLKAHGLATDRSALTVFASPRRLGAHVSGVLAVAADKAQSVKLMPASVGLGADGQATPALLKKLASLGADASVLPSLKRQLDGKAEALYFDSVVPGATLAAGLQKALDESLAKLPIPKLMTYQPASGALPGWSNVQFVRPAHGLVALHGPDVVAVTALGLKAGRETHGHRFEAAVDPVVLEDADRYAQALREQGAVIASFGERRNEIAQQLQRAAAAEGLQPIDDDALLDEVTALVERPNVLLGRFDASFLDVPQECLILTMKANQKYFPLLDAEDGLTSKFLIVSNINPTDASRVVEGNERVVRPRLADAKFFFEQDKKKTLTERIAGLGRVTYHAQLGTQLERTERVRSIASEIARRLIKAGTLSEREMAEIGEAAYLAKTDLLTDMVGEFPELQGTMGRYYAFHDGKTRGIADAIEDQYKPRFAADTLPRGRVGVVLALADKLETLIGLFGIGQTPSGDKDPFALRRHAIGVLRMLDEKEELRCLSADELATLAIQTPNWPPSVLRILIGPTGSRPLRDVVLEFLGHRLAFALREQWSAREVDAVLANNLWWTVSSTQPRLRAVRHFLKLAEAEPLAFANKRVANILRKSDAAIAENVDPSRFIEPAEAALATALDRIRPVADTAFDHGDYTASLQALAALKEPVDAFFEHVMVNVDDEKLRANRLGLLATLHAAMNRVADLSKLAG